MVNAKEIIQVAQSRKKELIKFLREIVAIPSPSGEEKKVAKRIAREMRRVGFDEVLIDELGSVIGRIGKGRVKILYDAHIDTVNIGDRNKWSFDPYKGKYEKGIIYGRGVCDDKCCVASMLYGGRLIKELGLEGDYTLYFTASVREEIHEGLALKHIIEKKGIRPDYVLIGEPSKLNIGYGHKGRIELKITTEGKSCHAATPQRGENAIYEMVPIVSRIERLNKRLKVKEPLGKGMIAVTRIETKNISLNTIPDDCTIYLDRRTTLGETKEKVIKELKSILGNAKAEIEVLKHENGDEKYYPEWILDKDHPLILAGIETYKTLFGKRPKIRTWPFCTNGSYTMGMKRIPTMGFGPGDPRYAHSIDEKIETDDLMPATAFYALFPSILEISEKVRNL
ncbi:YgeY family selenium metabolism-linked hydrolase [bacterium]|nr:YgeY family selenium metabolism-linked hydrolase [bacterium]